MKHLNDVEVQPIARAEWEGGEKWIAIAMKEGSEAEFARMPVRVRCEGQAYGKAHFLSETRTAAYSTRHLTKYSVY